ncbi:MAG: signal peptide peptidase SppA [Planctomycetota bacterium]|nr:MAG: signal peptide peptidase SppA [Planctomycetota bacterium]
MEPVYEVGSSGPGAQASAPPERRRGSGCLVALALLLFVALGVSVLANFGFLAMLGAGATEGPIRERTVRGEGEAKVALIELRGVILDEVEAGSALLPIRRRLVERLEREFGAAEKDEKVVAVLLRIDSPGGAVSTSDRIWHLVRTFRERSGKPVVVSMGGVCASGGYYVASACDRLVAEPSTITGSIGVILRSFNVSKLLARLDVEPVTLTSGQNKNLLDPFEPPNPEHRRIVQATIDEAYERFVRIVAEGRAHAGLDEAAVRKLADGRIYTARTALDNKLVDAIGYLEDAFGQAKQLAKVERARLVRYEERAGLFGWLEARLGAPQRTELSLAQLLEHARPRLYALWWATP